jgi:hypothetical protein
MAYGLPPFGLHILQRTDPTLADTDVEALGDQLCFGAHDAGQQDIADPVIDGVFVWYPAFLDQSALHPDLRGHRRDHPRMVIAVGPKVSL